MGKVCVRVKQVSTEPVPVPGIDTMHPLRRQISGGHLTTFIYYFSCIFRKEGSKLKSGLGQLKG